jgi:catechol 2,3-dioxygenase-like lactoylglutathione lyase family enzyme
MATCRYIVDDVDAAVGFYTSQLGFEVKQQFGPAVAILQRDDLELWVAGPTASASRPMPDGAQPAPGGWNRFVLIVDNLDETLARMKGNGVRFRNEVVEGPGGRQILCLDPSNNPIELFERA